MHNKKIGKNSCGRCCTKIKNLTVSFGHNVVLKNINLHIHCGELTAVIGPNGAGKSTLFRAIIGDAPHSGEICFSDFESNRKMRPKIGYVPQTLLTDKNSPISVLDLFAITSSRFPAWLGAQKKLKSRALSLLSVVDAKSLINRSISDLSGGELQRVLLALALFDEPDVLLLDEPVSGVDRNGLDIFYRILDKIRKNFDLTAIIISHDHKRIAKHADRFILLNKEILAQGNPLDVLNSDEYTKIFGGGDVK